MAQAAVPTTLRMTWEEFLNWNPEHRHWEWVDGEVIAIMSGDERHESVLGFLYMLLRAFTLHYGVGRALIAPFLMRLAFRPAGRKPDLLYVTQENLHRIQGAVLDGPADLAIEVVSPESEERDNVTKLAEYERAGVREYWLIDHRIREAKFYRLDAQGHYQEVFPDATGRYDSLSAAGFWLNVNWLWQEPKPFFDAARQLGLMG